MAAPQPSDPVVGAPYMTAEQVGKELLQCSSKSVHKLAKSDPSMPKLKFNGLVRFPRERLVEWLRQREQGRPPMRSRVRSIKKSGTSVPSAAPCADACAGDGAQ